MLSQRLNFDKLAFSMQYVNEIEQSSVIQCILAVITSSLALHRQHIVMYMNTPYTDRPMYIKMNKQAIQNSVHKEVHFS